MENVMDRKTGYIEDACVCSEQFTSGSVQRGERIPDEDCPVHPMEPEEWLNESTDPEELQNFREFARTLPLLDDCAFSCEYIPFRMGELEGEKTCWLVRDGWMYEGVGSDEAAAYGRMVIAIVEREV